MLSAGRLARRRATACAVVALTTALVAAPLLAPPAAIATTQPGPSDQAPVLRIAPIDPLLQDGEGLALTIEIENPGPEPTAATTLDVLLDYLRVESVVVTGVAANICVLFTANDAYMRDFHVVVPSDCVASNTEEINRTALEEMAKVLKADTRPSTELTFPYARPDDSKPKHPAPPSTEFAPRK